MKNRNVSFRVIVGLFLITALCSSEAYAWGGGRHTHYYRGDKCYSHRWFWFDTAVAVLAIGTLVDNLPPRHTSVVYSGVPYYYADGYYYRTYPAGGYVVVNPPPVVAVKQDPVVVTSAPAQAADGSITINIPNAHGGYTVALKKTNNGYIGPQGEYYAQHPTVEQLKALYGED